MILRPVLLATALLLLPPMASAELTTAAEIEECVRDNLPRQTAVQTVSLTSHDRIGAVTTSRAKIYWRRADGGASQVLLRIQEPADIKGAGLLLLEKEPSDEVLMYLPELARIRRVTSRMASTSMFGTDFTYEQFERIHGLSKELESTRLEDDTQGERPVYVVESKPSKRGASGFETIKSFIDKETCLPLRVEYYEKGELRKVLEADAKRIEELEGSHLTRRLVMQDLRDETATELVIEKIEIGAAIPASVFTEAHLESGKD